MQINYRVNVDKTIEFMLYNDQENSVGTSLHLSVAEATKLLNAIQNAIDETKKG
jgi:hypothetical protein